MIMVMIGVCFVVIQYFGIVNALVGPLRIHILYSVTILPRKVSVKEDGCSHIEKYSAKFSKTSPRSGEGIKVFLCVQITANICKSK